MQTLMFQLTPRRKGSFDFRKLAELGSGGSDSGTDSDFEAAFADIAHSVLRDKAPTLQQYEVGFQLLDRNEEGNRAVGITGFKIGKHWVYAPVFFLQGKLKGQELLYLKNEDQFIPLKEDWINDLVNKKPSVLGESIDRNSSRLGISAPDMQFFSRSPTYKFSSAIHPGLLPGMAAFSYFATHSPYTDKKYEGMIDLPTFLKKEGKAVIRALCRTLTSFPKLAEAFEKTYGGLEVIREAIELHRSSPDSKGVLGKAAMSSCKTHPLVTWARRKKHPSGVLPQPKKADPVQEGKLAYYTRSAEQEVLDKLSNQEREEILRSGIVFMDKRAAEEVSVAYKIQEPWALMNPDQTGVYELLVSPGKFEKCLIIMRPYSARQHEPFATVIRLEEDRNYLNCHPYRLHVKPRSDLQDKEFSSLLESSPDADSLPADENDTYYVLVNAEGIGTCPLKARYASLTDGDAKTYEVSVRDYAEYNRPGDLPRMSESDDAEYSNYYPSNGERVHLTGKTGAALKVMAGDLYVPAGYKRIKAKERREVKEMISGDGYSGEVYRSEPPDDVQPGSRLDVQRVIFDKTAGLAVSHSGSEVQIDGLSMAPLSALIHLVVDHGFREKTARAILQEAEKRKICKVRVKYAAPYDDQRLGYELQQSAPMAPSPQDPLPYMDGSFGNGYPAYGPQEWTQRVYMPRMDPGSYDPNAMPDPNAMQSAMTMAQGGQKEIFDASMMGSLLHQMRDDTMVDRHLPELMRALDKLGRILFSLYWHGEEFQDRYGKQDLPKLEDGLRHSFESLGDTIKGLQQQSLEPFPGEMGVDLSDVAR